MRVSSDWYPSWYPAKPGFQGGERNGLPVGGCNPLRVVRCLSMVIAVLELLPKMGLILFSLVPGVLGATWEGVREFNKQVLGLRTTLYYLQNSPRPQRDRTANPA